MLIEKMLNLTYKKIKGTFMRSIIMVILSVSLFFVGCTKKDEKYYLDAAKNSLQKEDVKAAEESYEKLMTEYPNGAYAVEALYDLGKIYQSKLDKNIEAEASLKKAIDIFQKLVDKYPKSKEAPPALFMTGFIQANELRNFDEAKKTYGKILKDYPTHE